MSLMCSVALYMVISSAGEKIKFGEFRILRSAVVSVYSPKRGGRSRCEQRLAGLLLHCTMTIVRTLESQVKRFLVHRNIDNDRGRAFNLNVQKISGLYGSAQ